MHFSFYPRHEHGCPNVSHCPHLGGAALGTLVLRANQSGDRLDSLHRTIDAQRESISKLLDEILQLKEALTQAKLELKLERQEKFATNQQQKEDEVPTDEYTTTEAPAAAEPKKRGAPVGHPGWFRPTPTQYDSLIEVPAPARCPHCDGQVTAWPSLPAVDHLQEDIIVNVYRVACCRRHYEEACQQRWCRPRRRNVLDNGWSKDVLLGALRPEFRALPV